LAGRGHDPEVVAAVLDELTAERLLSDRRYAETLIANRRARGVGPIRIATELREAGVAEAEFRELLGAGADDWIDAARAARVKRFGARKPASFAESARQRRFLEYRGYTPAQIRAALGAADPADPGEVGEAGEFTED
jgi:regulatory protein